MPSTIELTNVKTIQHLAIPVPEDGGVCVLRGRNGSGKTSALEAIDSLVSGRNGNRLEARDGAAKGEVSGFGARLTIGRQTRRSGELEVTSLEGKLDVSSLVDPGLKGADEADAKRIKALCQLGGVKPDSILFRERFGDPEEFDRIVSVDAVKSDDILVMADRIKRCFDTAARNTEGLANTERSHAAACAEAADGIDTAVVTDADKLQSDLETAIRTEQSLKTRKQQYIQHAAKIEEARSELDKARSSEWNRDVEQARQIETFAHNEYADALEKLEAAKKALASAESGLQSAKSTWERKQSELAAAERQAEIIATWKKTLEESGEAVAPPEESELFAATDAVDAARQAIEAGVKARSAVEKIAKRKTHLARATDLDRKAERLREAAKGVDDVLSAQIGKLGCALRVEAGRLVTNTRRGPTLFSELSEGERWKIALDIAIDAVGRGGLLTLSQDCWESLDPINRQLIVEHVRGSGVVLLTAQASADEELTTEVLN